MPLPQLEAVGFKMKNLFIFIVFLLTYSNSLYYAGKIQECGYILNYFGNFSFNLKTFSQSKSFLPNVTELGK